MKKLRSKEREANVTKDTQLVNGQDVNMDFMIPVDLMVEFAHRTSWSWSQGLWASRSQIPNLVLLLIHVEHSLDAS